MNLSTNNSIDRPKQGGGALATAVHALLLVVILGQVVYLASRYRMRWDLTSDQRWSLTDSTRNIVEGLSKQLLVEAYFSPAEDLPVTMRATRTVLDNFLDELTQLGKGRVVIQRYDPNSDKAISDRCTRIGVKPVDLRGASATSFSVDRHWQGLRIVFGGSKQKVIAQLAPQASSQAEMLITRAIKEVVTTEKTQFGYMEWPVSEPGQQQGLGWNALRTIEDIARRFSFQNYKSEDAPLIPEDVDTLFLFRPKELTDREKYVLDQFVVGGGTLVVFADASQYRIGQQRAFSSVPLALDSGDSKTSFIAQLNSYGVDWKPKVVADMARVAHSPRNMGQGYEYFAVPTQTPFGRQMRPVPYPYFFHPVPTDWSGQAAQFARDPATGEVDEAIVEQIEKTAKPGFPNDEFVFSQFKRVNAGPGFYWPTWVGLRRKAGGELDLPAGIEGDVHLWSSPGALVEDPPQMLNPVGFGDPRAQQQELQKFFAKLNGRFAAEPRMQAPLMCEVRGKFSSFFANGDRPLRPSEVKEQEARAAAEARAAEKAAAEEGGEGEEAGAEKPSPEKPSAEEVGPPSPEAPADADAEPEIPVADPERDRIVAAEEPGRIIMIGDSDFIRDDLVRGQYAQLGGPASLRGGAFFNALLEWLAEDDDLVALQARQPIDRTLKLMEDPPPGADPRDVERDLNRKTMALRGVNVLLPCLLLGAFGLMVFLLRRSQKRSFLESLN